MFLLLAGGNGLWIWYGIKLKDALIIVANSFACLMDLLMLFMKFRYNNKPGQINLALFHLHRQIHPSSI